MASGPFVTIGGTSKPLQEALREGNGAILLTQRQLEQLGVSADHTGQSVEHMFKSFKREQVQEGRLVGFYVRELAEFTGAGKESQEMMKGFGKIGASIAFGAGPWVLAFEAAAVAGKMITDHFKESEEAQKKVLEATEKWADALEKRIEAVLNRVHDKLLLIRGIDLGEATIAGGINEANRGLSDAIGKLKSEDKSFDFTTFKEHIAGDPDALKDFKAAGSLYANVARAWEARQKAYEAMEKYRSDSAVVGMSDTNAAIQKQYDKELKEGTKAAQDLANERRKIEKELADAETKIWMDYADEVQKYPQLIDGALAVAWQKINRLREDNAAKAEKLRLDEVQQTALADVKGMGPELEDYGVGHKTRTEILKEADLHAATAGAKQFKTELHQIEAAGQAIGDVFSTFGQLIGGSIGKVLGVLGQAITKAFQLAIAFVAAGQASTGPWGWIAIGAAVASTIAALAIGFAAAPRQLGGPVAAGSPYIVGEVGPELFVPNTGGSVVPNSAFGGSTTYIINALDASTFRQYLRSNQGIVLDTIGEALRNGRRI